MKKFVILAICLLPMLWLSGCVEEKTVIKTKVIKVPMCAAQPMALVTEPAPLQIGHTRERDVWIFAKQNREALRACNAKLTTQNQELSK